MCHTYGWSYTTSGIYEFFTNSSGCDSLVVLNLTINSSDTLHKKLHDTYWLKYLYSKWNLNSLFTNSSGCDSLVF